MNSSPLPEYCPEALACQILGPLAGARRPHRDFKVTLNQDLSGSPSTRSPGPASPGVANAPQFLPPSNGLPAQPPRNATACRRLHMHLAALTSPFAGSLLTQSNLISASTKKSFVKPPLTLSLDRPATIMGQVRMAGTINSSVSPNPVSAAFSADRPRSPRVPRVVIVGGVAGGGSVCGRLRRLCEDAEISMFERGPDVSYANCAIPYYIGGTIADAARLAIHTPQSLKQLLDIHVHVNTIVTRIDIPNKTITVQNKDGTCNSVPFDKLVLSPGARPFIPPVTLIGGDTTSQSNINSNGAVDVNVNVNANANGNGNGNENRMAALISAGRVLTLRSLQDMHKIKQLLTQSIAQRVKPHVSIIGAGFIGIEMCEQLRHLGVRVTMVERELQILPVLDPEMTTLLEQQLVAHGVTLKLGTTIKTIALQHGTGTTMVTAPVTSLGTRITTPTESGHYSVGVVPESELARDAGLRVSASGHILVNEYQQSSNPDIYAVGDVCMTEDGVIPKQNMVAALAGPANRQGRLVADHIANSLCQPITPLLPPPPSPNTASLTLTSRPTSSTADPTVTSAAIRVAERYAGSLGTAIVRAFDAAAGIVGWSEKRLHRARLPYDSCVVTEFDHASWYPGANQVTVKLTWDRQSGQLYGGQVFGSGATGSVDKRLDVLATALRAKMNIQDIAQLELAYAPQYGAAKDVLNIAGFAACNQMSGLVRVMSKVDMATDIQVIDVREGMAGTLNPVVLPHNGTGSRGNDGSDGVRIIPMSQLRAQLHTLDRNRPVLTICNLGKTSYFASRLLSQHGFNVYSLGGGLKMHPELTHPVRPLPTASAMNMAPLPGPGSCTPPSHHGGSIMSTGTAAPIQANPPSVSVSPPIELDCTGLACPGPIVRLQQAVQKLQPGQLLIASANDPGFVRDFPAFCRVTGHELVSIGHDSFKQLAVGQLRKPFSAQVNPAAAASVCGPGSGTGTAAGATVSSLTTGVTVGSSLAIASRVSTLASGAPSSRGGAALIVFSCELDRVLAALTLANGVCAMRTTEQIRDGTGTVTVFFTFWGLALLRKPGSDSVWRNLTAPDEGDGSSSRSFLDRIFSVLTVAGSDSLPLSHLNAGGYGNRMMQYQMAVKQLPNISSLLAQAKQCGVKLVACSMSMTAMGVRACDFIDGVEIGGVADYLAAAHDSDLKLFI